MFLNLTAFILIPVYTLLFVRNFNLFSLNFSVIGNMLGRKRGFCLWGIMTGWYFYAVLSPVSSRLKLPAFVRHLVHTALLLLFFAVTTPYLPEEFPLKAFLHIIFAMAAALCLCLYLFFASWQLRVYDRTAGITALWCLALILGISAALLILVGIVSSALEIFFTFSTVFLSRYLYGRTKRLISQSP